MFTFYIENHEPFGALTKNSPKLDKNKSIASVQIFGIFNLQIGNWYRLRKQLCWMFQFSSVNACICTSIS